MKIIKNKKVLVIAGTTGAGESTITNEIIKSYPIFTRLVTATTRKPRLKEKNRKDYYFFSIKRFKQEIKKGNILEHTYIKNRNVYYGSFKPDLDRKIKKGFNIIINPDLVGAKFYQKNYNAATIFIMPDSLKNLKKRLTVREPNISKEELKKRLGYAKYEIRKEAPFYNYIVINRQGKLNGAINKVKKIIKNEGYILGAIDKN